MKKERFELHVSGRAISSHTGYRVGNFFVYKAHYYWRIAHAGTNSHLTGDYARRKDALAVIEAMDSEAWAFDTVPENAVLASRHAEWIKARGICDNRCGILRLPEGYVASASHEHGPQQA